MNIMPYPLTTTNDIHPVNAYLPINADSLEEVTQYYKVREQEWFSVEIQNIERIDNGVFIAHALCHGYINAISIYIPYSLRGKGLLKSTLNMNEYRHFDIVTMNDCHVFEILSKYVHVDKIYNMFSFSDFFAYRDLRNLLCDEPGINEEYLLWDIHTHLKLLKRFNTMPLECVKMIQYAYHGDIKKIHELITKKRH